MIGLMATEPPLGTRIKRARERKRWTQQRLADAVDVSQKTIDNWENGRTSPRSSIGALEEVLGVSLAQDEPPYLGIVARDDHERYVLAHQNLSDEDKRLMIASHRRHPLPDPEPGKDPGGVSPARHPGSAAS